MGFIEAYFFGAKVVVVFKFIAYGAIEMVEEYDTRVELMTEMFPV